MPSPFLTAEWRHLAMLNYEIDPECLKPYVPAGTELDTWNGGTFVSMVGFLFLKTRVRGIAIPWHQNFEEINLRFYVKRTMKGEARRGVVFMKEIVPRRAIASVARIFYNENYVALPTRHELAVSEKAISAKYQWKLKGSWNGLSLKTTGGSFKAKSGSIEEFITEHYWGYSRQKNGSCVEYKVEHPSWNLWQGRDARLDCDVEKLYGEAFVPALGVKPISAFLAEGSPVTVYRGMKL